jgi:hypothetical protein
MKASAAREEHHAAGPFPDRPPLRPAEEGGGSTNADPPVQALSAG